jgi:hypothetical protein
MLYVPFAVGLLVAGSLSWAVLLLAIATTFVFIARESLLAWWRGRSRNKPQPKSLRLMIIYFTLATISGLPLVLSYNLYWLLPLGLVTVTLLGINTHQGVRREDRTISGEMLAILGLTLTAPTAYYVARGSFDLTALWLWALCAGYFASSVFYVKLRVHTLNPRMEEARRQSLRRCILYHSLLLGSLIFFSLNGPLSLFALVAFAPVLGRTLWFLIKPVNRVNLRRLGLLEMAYSLFFLLFMAVSFRTF